MWQSFVCAMTAAVTLQALDPFRTGKLVLYQVTYSSGWHGFEMVPFALLGIFGVRPDWFVSGTAVNNVLGNLRRTFHQGKHEGCRVEEIIADTTWSSHPSYDRGTPKCTDQLPKLIHARTILRARVFLIRRVLKSTGRSIWSMQDRVRNCRDSRPASLCRDPWLLLSDNNLRSPDPSWDYSPFDGGWSIVRARSRHYHEYLG